MKSFSKYPLNTPTPFKVMARDIPKLKVRVDEFIPFISEHKKLIITETLAACEELIQTDDESIDVIQIQVFTDETNSALIECKVFREDMGLGLQKLLKASIEEEEYEISQRVKLLQDYLSILNA
jgi:hypothetical protein